VPFDKFIKDYIERGFLKKQQPNFKMIENHILRAGKELKAAEANLKIDEGVAFTVAYTAMLHAGRALTLFKGFRPSDGSQHKTVVDFTSQILGDEYKQLIQHFDRMRRKRNLFTYEVSFSISQTEAENALKNATKFVKTIQKFIKKENPQMSF